MLEPQSRKILLEALRPPDGFAVDRVVATTFTLDLTALLTAPLAFSLYDELFASERGRAGADPIDVLDPYALLQAVRGHAEHITVFCESTRIAAPAKYRRLLGYLERSVVQVQAPSKDGVFHPKLWLLRFCRDQDDQVRYRCLCLSRNLTFDRSWDTILSLDGEYTRRTNAFADNHPLGDFVAALPGLAVLPMDAKRKRSVLDMADEVRRVKFELPENVESIRFHPLGIEGRGAWPFDERIERLLVVSPFVTDGALKRLAIPGRRDVLISRRDQLDAIPSVVLDAFDSLYVLDAAAELEDDGPSESDATATPAESVANGLHAKVYVADDGRNAHVWTGSANATATAFERNVEFLIQLTGKKKLLGVEAFLDGPNGSGGLRPLLATFTPPAEPVCATELQRRLEKRLQAFRATLGRCRWVAVAGSTESERYPLSVELRGESLDLADGITLETWPITLQRNRAQNLRPPLKGLVADFGLCSFDALTSFFAFAVRVTEGVESLEEVFVLNVVLEGVPEDRDARILQSLLDDPAKFVRFLKLLLAVDPLDVIQTVEIDAPEDATFGITRAASEGTALLETLLRALDRDPAHIDAVEQIVRDLSTTEAGRRAFPSGFDGIWPPILAARTAARRRGRS